MAFRRAIRKIYTLSVASTCLVAVLWFPSEVNAIPESEALKKLQVIPVFVITDAKGVPLPIPRDRQLVLPLYLERSKAYQQLDSLRKSNPSLNASVVALPLDLMNKKVAELNANLKDKTKKLIAPIVGNDQDRRQAELILQQQGMTARQINESLNVPVFFTKPFLTINTPNGPRGVFFFRYQSMVDALAKLAPSDRQTLKPQVADLTAALREIINEPSDRFTIFPTPDYFDLVKENQNKRSSETVISADIPTQLPDSNTLPPTDSGSDVILAPTTVVSKAKVAAIARTLTVRIEGPGPSGSGTIVKKTDAGLYIATAWHVLSDVARGESIRIVFEKGAPITVPYTSLSRVGNTDLGIIRLDINSQLSSLLAPVIAQVNPGDSITVSGWSLATRDNPVLYRHLPGTVVSVNPNPPADGYSILYTTSSPTIEGMSGGPVLNDSGQLIGIHGKAERLPQSDVEGVKEIATTNGQAIPISLMMSKI